MKSPLKHVRKPFKTRSYRVLSLRFLNNLLLLLLFLLYSILYLYLVRLHFLTEVSEFSRPLNPLLVLISIDPKAL